MYEELKKAKESELSILIELDRICQKYGIKYYLTYGTLLGCIRHKGFIPWDDDIDVFMFRTEYTKFRDACEKELNSQYKLLFYDSVNNYPYVYPKMMNTAYRIKEKSLDHLDFTLGFYVDIFILYGTSKYSIKRFIDMKIDYFLYALNRLYGKDDNKLSFFLRKIKKIIFHFYSVNSINKYKDKRLSRYELDNSDLVYRHGYYNKKSFIKSSYFKETILNEFEGKQFLIPKNWKEFLTYEYGDFMKLPNKDDRIPLHNYILLDEDI